MRKAERLEEFARWVVALDHSSERRVITLPEIIAKAKEALYGPAMDLPKANVRRRTPSAKRATKGEVPG